LSWKGFAASVNDPKLQVADPGYFLWSVLAISSGRYWLFPVADLALEVGRKKAISMAISA
jgi:hypothetical protein